VKEEVFSMKRLGLFFLAALFLNVGDFMSESNAQQSTACTAPEHRQFDFWLGDWEVKDPKGNIAGTNLITSEFAGCVLQEHWVGSQGGRGSSFNIFSSSDKKWHQAWVDDSGTFLNLIGGFEDGKMVLVNDAPVLTDRITWNVVDGDKDRVRQHWEQSQDGGKTWKTAFDGLYIRKAL
jgi:hypothetical protein